MKKLVIANWKMNPKTLREAKKLLEATKKAADAAKSVSVVIAPPAVFLRPLRDAYKGAKLAFCAQNAHSDPEGAHTGETSLAQIKDAKAAYVIVGHSEARARGVSSEETGRTVAAALAEKLTPVLCVGETRRTGSGEHFALIQEQLRCGMADVPAAKLPQVIVAYEPVWAIGGEKAMEARDMQEMNIFIHKMLYGTHGDRAMQVRVLYGGSANETNAKTMIEEGTAAGLLVGHVSIEPARFGALLSSL